MTHNWGRSALAGLLLTATLMGGAQAATVTVFDSQAALGSAFSDMGVVASTDDFEDGRVGPGLNVLSFGGPHVVGMRAQDFLQAGIYGQSFLQANGATGGSSQYLDSVSTGSSSYLETVWFFSRELRGVGADWDLGVHGDGESLRLYAMFAEGEQYVGDISPATLGASRGYFGFTSDTSFIAVILRGAGRGAANAETFSMDNLMMGHMPTAVPEPETVAMWLMGLAGLGLRSRRRRSSALQAVTESQR